MSKIFRYEEVMKRVEEVINGLALKPGDKLPSVRKVSEELKVSHKTVLQAYALLEAKGLIVSRPRSGYFIDTVSTGTTMSQDNAIIPLPAVVELNTMATTMMKNARVKGVINFSMLAPANELLPVSRLNKALNTALAGMGVDNYQYPMVTGHPCLLKQIARHTLEWPNGLPVDKILITNGCMEAVNLCLDILAKPGDIIAVESPTYHGILESLEIRGLKAVEIRVDNTTGLRLDDLSVVLATYKITACIFMPSCHHPLGCSMPEENKKQLVRMLGERNIPLIEDDALGELHFEKNRSLPAKAYDGYDNVLYCSSFSKTLAPGFRIGWLSAGKYQAAAQKLKWASNISTTGILQEALGRFLESGRYPAHLNKLRLDLQENVSRYLSAVNRYFPQPVRIHMPAGGLSLWIGLPADVDTLQLQRKVLEQGIGICPGHIFAASQIYNNYVRINYGAPWSARIDKALKKAGSMISQTLQMKTIS
ncbi:PLP-dependent aminotransferase family protein [Chitinophaga sp. S165]|uniref:aminotransferase-like domain-containing protein n=1 Tax=Chitinophaga sp. S165 TaxID=2135462 RepID=UPI000DA0FF0F|nr:PLP-dependent aminotransferase family protein [Chitinophaga sp. S165]PWV56579.1 GntR family transcriptional regulator [Chitinophaga sp. S165]